VTCISKERIELGYGLDERGFESH